MKIDSSAKNWEEGKLGLNPDTAKRAPAEEAAAIDAALGLRPISIRLEHQLIADLKEIAKHEGIGYQPMIRDLLHRFASHELPLVLAKRLEEAQRRESDLNAGAGSVADYMRKTA